MQREPWDLCKGLWKNRTVVPFGSSDSSSPTASSGSLKWRFRHIKPDGRRVVSEYVEPLDHATEYERLVASAGRVDQLLGELESWLHARERGPSTVGNGQLECDVEL